MLRVPDALLPISLLTKLHEKLVDYSIGTYNLTTHVGDPDGVPGSWLRPGPSLTDEAFWAET